MVVRFIHLVLITVLRRTAEIEFKLEGALGRTFFRRRYLSALNVKVGSRFVWGIGSYLHLPGNLVLGERSGVGSFARIYNYNPIMIGDDVVCAGGLTINTGGHDPLTMRPIGGGLKIGDRVWIGTNVTILGDLEIGDDVVIAAGSVVVSSIPANSIAAGAPARVVKPLDRKPDTPYWDWTIQEFRKQL